MALITDGFRDLTGSVASWIMAFDNALGNLAIITILFLMIVVLASTYIGINREEGDFLTAITNAVYLITVFAIMLYLVKVGDARLLSFTKLSIFLTLSGLSILAKKIGDR